MIYGIGLDIIEVERVAKKTESKAFLEKVFTTNEIELFKSREFNPQVIAGNFAAKEAFLKALGTGINSGFLDKIEILRHKNGKPYIVLLDSAKKYADHEKISNIFVSITNIKDLAAAQVILEKE